MLSLGALSCYVASGGSVLWTPSTPAHTPTVPNLLVHRSFFLPPLHFLENCGPDRLYRSPPEAVSLSSSRTAARAGWGRGLCAACLSDKIRGLRGGAMVHPEKDPGWEELK